jgi:hypothetical protein
LLVRLDLEITELESARRAVVQVEDDALRRVRALDVVPAWAGDARAVRWVGSEIAGEVDE